MTHRETRAPTPPRRRCPAQALKLFLRAALPASAAPSPPPVRRPAAKGHTNSSRPVSTEPPAHERRRGSASIDKYGRTPPALGHGANDVCLARRGPLNTVSARADEHSVPFNVAGRATLAMVVLVAASGLAAGCGGSSAPPAAVSTAAPAPVA